MFFVLSLFSRRVYAKPMKALLFLLALTLSAFGQSPEMARFEASRERALRMYPASADATTPLGAAIAKEVGRMKAAKDPALASPESPEIVATRVAGTMGIAPLPLAPVATAATPTAAEFLEKDRAIKKRADDYANSILDAAQKQREAAALERIARALENR